MFYTSEKLFSNLFSLDAYIVGLRPGRGDSKESFSSYQETGKGFSTEIPFYSKYGNT